MAYQSYLAQEVAEYEIERHANGQFDLTDGTHHWTVRRFFKRRQQILAVAGPNSSWVSEKAWSTTRKRKENVEKEVLLLKWREEAAVH